MKVYLFVLLMVAGGCANKTLLAPDSAVMKSEESGQGLNAQVIWVKNKKSAVDVLVRFSNRYPHSVFLKNKALQMAVTGTQVGPKDPNFAFELGAGQSAEKVLIFAFGDSKPKSGTATLMIAPQNTETAQALPVLKMDLPLVAN